MPKVFISYAHDDQQIASRLVSELQDVSLPAWMAAADVNAGEPIMSKLREELACSSAVVVLLSPKSLASSWVQFEIGAARALGKPIVPVLIEGDGVEGSIPDSLSEVQSIDARREPLREVARRIEEALG
ncbi:MAG: toll/interleukin-1 receptor domain-containing protein [Planctomycetota bacterium]|jgi:hypothetical protein